MGRQTTMSKTYIASEDTQVQIKNLVSQINNQIGNMSLGGATPHITVEAPTGCTVTAVNGSTTVTFTETSGVYHANVPNFGAWEIRCTKSGHTGKRIIQVVSLTNYNVKMSYGYRYGVRIKKSEGSPGAKVEYLFDAVGMEPAHMDYSRGIFDYGDWGNIWFVKDNKPLMLKSNRTVDYYLNPDNYAEKEDGTASDITNDSYDGNAMAQFPLVWVK